MDFSNITVKTPPSTWQFVYFETNLPIGEFYISTISRSFSMNQKIPVFSSAPKEDDTSSSPIAQTKSPKLSRFRCFNHDPMNWLAIVMTGAFDPNKFGYRVSQ
jgi:hypothetical protein